MKKLLLLIAIVILVVFAVMGIWAYLTRTNDVMEQEPPVTFPLEGPGSVRNEQQPRSILDFPDTKEDPENPGYYYLRYQTFGDDAVQEPPYLIAYIAETQYFNIVLRTEPIGEVRKAVEDFLLQRLELTEDEMCRLNYTVAVPAFVNSEFSGTNLGFSFCPGAVPLP